MNKNTLRHFKLGILLFGFCIIFTNCQKENIKVSTESQLDSRVKHITFAAFKSKTASSENYQKLNSFFDFNKTQGHSEYNRLEASDGAWIITDEVVMIEREDKIFYTFKIGTITSSESFYNLLVTTDIADEIIDLKIFEYIPSSTWLEDVSQPFTGRMKLNDDDIFSISDLNGMLDRGGQLCITGTRDNWLCNLGYNHAPGEGTDCTSWTNTITAIYGQCPPVLTPGGDPNEGVPVGPGSSGGGGGGGSGNGTGTTNNDCVPAIDNPCDEDETFILPPREPKDDDCNTSKEDLKKIFPNMPDANAELLASIINDKGQDFGINSDEDLWHFLSQAGHETGGFNTLNVTESTNYSTASLLPTRYSRFTMDSTLAVNDNNKYFAPDYVHNSAGVANVGMCCLYGNGNVESGDGYKYRGRGIFQLTWKDNYTAFKIWYNNKYDPDIDPVTSPDIIASNDTLGILSGLWYYKIRVVDVVTIDSATTVDKVTILINGKKKIGLADRKERFQKAKDSINCL